MDKHLQQDYGFESELEFYYSILDTEEETRFYENSNSRSKRDDSTSTYHEMLREIIDSLELDEDQSRTNSSYAISSFLDQYQSTSFIAEIDAIPSNLPLDSSPSNLPLDSSFTSNEIVDDQDREDVVNPRSKQIHQKSIQESPYKKVILDEMKRQQEASRGATEWEEYTKRRCFASIPKD